VVPAAFLPPAKTGPATHAAISSTTATLHTFLIHSSCLLRPDGRTVSGLVILFYYAIRVNFKWTGKVFLPFLTAGALAGDDEIVALTIGDGDASWAAARGASRTVVVSDALTVTDSAQTGAVIAAAVRRDGDADVVIVGDSSWDYGVVAALTGQLGRAAVAGVVSAEAGTGCVRVTRRMGAVQEVLQVDGPVVLAASASQEEKNPPGMKEVLKARKKPMEKLMVADLGLALRDAAHSQGTKFPDTPSAHMIDGADPAAACEEFMAAMRTEGII
jgi:electron transfer flavoprotein beta subunit